MNDIAYTNRTVQVMEAKTVSEDGETIQLSSSLVIYGWKKRILKSWFCLEGNDRKSKLKGLIIKKCRYQIEHINSYQYQAMKNHYLMIQITDIMMQFYDHGVILFKTCNKTIKEKSSNLLQAIRTRN